MVCRFMRSLGALISILCALLLATPAMAVNKTVNGITADVNLPQIQRGVAYTFQIAPIGPGPYTGPYTLSVLSSNLPAGIAINSSGLVSGTTCSANGNYTPQNLRIDDNNGTVADFTGSTSFSVNVTTAPANGCSVTVTATTPPATQSTTYTGQVTGSGTSGPYIYTVSSGALPPGVTLNANTGAITGTPTAVGTYTFSILATDNSSSPASTGVGGPFSIAVAASSGITLTVNPATLPSGTSGTAYSQAITASGGTGPYSFSVTSGALPTGLTLAANGTLAGTPTSAGSYNFTIGAVDANGDTGSRAYTVTIAPGNILTLSPATLPSGTAGTAYSQTVTATGGLAPYTYAVTGGTLPAGLMLAANGTLSGTPTTPGSYSFTVTGTDANGDFGTRSYSVAIAAGNTLTLNPSTLPAATSGTLYNESLSATGGIAPYTYAVTGGALPTGLVLASNGTLSGTPSTPGTYNFTITGTDSNGNFGSRSYSIIVAPGGTLTLNPSTLPSGTAGTAYGQTVTATGGLAPYTYAVTGGTLPAGLMLAANGTLSGTPTTPGTYSFTVTGTDANGDFGTRSYSVAIAAGNTLTLNPSTLPAATSGTPYNESLSATGGTAPYTYAVTSGALPAGLALASNGTLSGTPSTPGTYNFTITGTDANGNFGSRSYSVTVAPGNILTVNPSTLPNGTSGAAYSQAISATGGTGPYTFAVASGSLPLGLTLDTNSGVVSGTPASAGNSNFTIQATDANGDFGTRAYTLTIGAGQILVVNPDTLPGGTNGAAYSQTLTATGGSAPYTFVVTAGTLPTGLALAADGRLLGTPTDAGTFTFTVTGTDANGDFGTRNYSVVIAGVQALAVTPGAVPGGNLNSPYNLQFVSTGGVGPYAYTHVSGTLPAGLILTSSGVLSGSPTTAGTYTFTVQAVDANGNFGVLQVTLVVGLSIRPDPTLNPGVVGGVTEQVGAARRAGELQMSHVMRRLASPGNCTESDDDGAPDNCNTGARMWATGTHEQNYSADGVSGVNALTVGADTQVGRARVGAAIGTGKDKADMASGFRNTADATSVLLYGRWALQQTLHVEAVVGRASMDMDSRRRMPDAAFAIGTREGDATFAAVGMSGQFTLGNFGLQPYARYETMHIALDGYTESSSPLALQYDALKTRTSAWVLGTEASYGMQFGWGRLTPSARLDLRARSGQTIAQALRYADRPGTVYVLDQAGVDSRSVMAALGLAAAFNGVTVNLEYGTAGSALDNFDGQSIQLQIRTGF